MTDMPNLVGGALCLDFVNTVDPATQLTGVSTWTAIRAGRLGPRCRDCGSGTRTRRGRRPAEAGEPAMAVCDLFPLLSSRRSGCCTGRSTCGKPFTRCSAGPPGDSRRILTTSACCRPN